MNSGRHYKEADAGTLPPFLIGMAPLGWDRSAESDWKGVQLFALSDTGAATESVTLEHVLPHGLRSGQTFRGSWIHGAYRLDAVELDVAEEAASHAVQPAVPDLLEGYDEYSEPNWDCYGAEPISAETIGAARQLLATLPNTLGTPHISPGSDGTIGLEWVFTARTLRKLFIDVGPGKVWSGYWRRTSGEKQTIPPTPIDAETEAALSKLFTELGK